MLKFKFLKREISRIVYEWALKCPKCGTVRRYDFEKDWEALDDKSGGLGIECKKCKLGQVITEKDLANARLISKEAFDGMIGGEE